MKTKLLNLILGSAVASVLATAVSATPLPSPANVRSGPGPRWPVVAQIPAGADIDVLGCYSGWQAGWCQVRYGKVKGYVNAGELAPSGANNVIVAPIITRDLANLRQGPGTNWPAIGVIPPSTPVNVTHCSQGWLYGWCKVTYAGQTGYVNSVLLQRQGAVYPE